MKPVVIDTNILLVANGSHPAVSVKCRLACIEALWDCKKSGVVVLDSAFLILMEYQRRTQPNQPKGPGDVFLKWLLQNKANRRRVHYVVINEVSPATFREFPNAKLQAKFDPADRKFVAVASAHPGKPTILQGADSKWVGWWKQLLDEGIKVAFLCPDDVQRFYSEKFPGGVNSPLPLRARESRQLKAL